MATWHVWERVLPTLVASRDVLAPTLPGHLGGPPLGRGPLTVADLADSVERELDAVGFECPDIVGNSLGGFVAFELARRGRARRIVAIGSMGMQTDDQARRITRRIARAHRVARALEPALLPVLALPGARRHLLRDGVVRGDLVPAGLARHLLHAGTRCDAPSLIAAMRTADGAMPRLESASEIANPTLLLRGEHDAAATGDQMVRFLTQLPNARLITLRGASHCPQLDMPDRVATEILDFTREVPPCGPSVQTGSSA